MLPGSLAGPLDGGEAAASDAEGTDLLPHKAVTPRGPASREGPSPQALILSPSFSPESLNNRTAGAGGCWEDWGLGCVGKV